MSSHLQPPLGLKALRALHMAVILWVLFGWVIHLKSALLAHVIAMPLFILHWKTNNGKCILTDLEAYWFKIPISNERAVFSRRMLKAIFKKEATESQGMRLIYILMTSTAILSAIHWYLMQ